MCILDVFVNIHFDVVLKHLSLLAPKLYKEGVFEIHKYLKIYLISLLIGVYSCVMKDCASNGNTILGE